jgi:DNA-binding response OmpR family regulator
LTPGTNHLAILIVDDDIDLCHLLKGVLKPRQYHVGTAHSLREAEECLISIKPAIVFLDHNLPDGMGIQFIPKIRAYDKNIKIVVMTADTSPVNEQKALQLGATYFLYKPFTPSVINDVIDNFFSAGKEKILSKTIK